jgi:aspartyl-tRNA(Asn)/glutamyl-tRNA(Gln) amidotransferase subunit A
MSDAELCFLSVAEASDRLRARTLSSVELTDAYLARIEAFDVELRSYITVTAEHARTQARAAEREIARGNVRGPLHGIPFGVKDMFETRGILTTAQSKVLAGNVPGGDATAVERLYSAGAVLLGKQTLHEFAHGGPSFDLPWPPARNPWNTAHYAGSSSSGSGAAVAAGLAAFALGTDTGGSVRTPAWLCGIVGFKPTFGLVGRGGVIPFSSSCDHVGPMTRTVLDAALVLQAIAGRDDRDPGSVSRPVPDLRASFGRSLRGRRIGVLRRHFEQDVPANAELVAAFETALATFRDLGATIENVDARSLHDYYAVRVVLTESELFARHQQHLRTHAGDYGDHFLGRTLAATLFSSADYLAAQRQRRRMIDEMAEVYARYDILMTPGGGPAPHLGAHRSLGAGQKWSTPSMGTMFSVTGAPALALPCGFSSAGLPLGMQIAGRPFEDGTVLAVGDAYERATRWRERRPPLAPHAQAPVIDARAGGPRELACDAALDAHVEAALQHAGLNLDARARALLLEAAPHAIAMARRLPRDLEWSDEPAAMFRLGG